MQAESDRLAAWVSASRDRLEYWIASQALTDQAERIAARVLAGLDYVGVIHIFSHR